MPDNSSIDSILGTTDRLFRCSQSAPYPFAFNHRVSTVFHDMVQRSIPGYSLSLELIAALAPQFCIDRPSVVVDLGCALGSSSLAVMWGIALDGQSDPMTDQAMVEHLKNVQNDCRVIAIDNSPDMLRQCRHRLNKLGAISALELQLADISECELPLSDLIVLHFTMQFLPRHKREGLLTKCQAALKPHGALLLFEKITENNLLRSAHTQFKRNCGYSHVEITKKRQALEGIMCIDSEQVHQQRLHTCGFQQVSCLFRALNFCGWIAQT